MPVARRPAVGGCRCRAAAWLVLSGVVAIARTAHDLERLVQDRAERALVLVAGSARRPASASSASGAAVRRARHRQRVLLADVAHVEVHLAARPVGTRRNRARRARRTAPAISGRPRASPSGDEPRSAACARRCWARSAPSSPQAEKLPACGGTTTVATPSSSASSVPNSGPAPPKATSAASRGSRPRSMVIAADRVGHLRARRCGSRRGPPRRRESKPSGSASGASARSASSRTEHARRRRSGPAGTCPSDQRGVGHRRLARRRGRSRPARGRRPRSAGRRAAARRRRRTRSSRRRRRSSARRPTASAAAGRRPRPRTAPAGGRRRSGRCRSWCRRRRRRSRGAAPARGPARRRPAAPATGPDMIVSNGRSAASAKVIAPPPERMISSRRRSRARPGPLGQPVQVGAKPAADERVDDGRAGALVLAVLARDAVRQRDVAGEAGLAQQPLRLQLVRRVGVGVDEGDGDGVDALLGERDAAAATSAGSSGACSAPSARMRPPTGMRRWRGTSGGGACQNRS